MIHINSDSLSVSLLHPHEDRDKTGSRYCTGCYIWQVRDANGHCLLSGPHFPSENPPPFDGQGMPEVFEALLGGDEEPVGAEVCVIGVGMVKRTSHIEPFHPRNNPHVAEPCSWDIEQAAGCVVMTTEQSYKEKSIKLIREARVDGKRIESISRVQNTGGRDVTLRWFSHPFFPLNSDFECGKISPDAILQKNPGYYMGTGGKIFMTEYFPWRRGLFQLVEVPNVKLNFSIPHPIAGTIKMQTSYSVIRCALWANPNTFSFEPFMQRVLNPEETFEWQVTIEF